MIDLAFEQRLLERLDRADVGLRRAALHRDADAGRHDVGAAVGEKLAGLDQIVDLEIDQHREVERLARLDPPLHHRGDVSDHHRLEAGGLLELRTELAHDHLGHPRAEDLQFGGVRGVANATSSGDENATETPRELSLMHFHAG